MHAHLTALPVCRPCAARIHDDITVMLLRIEPGGALPATQAPRSPSSRAMLDSFLLRRFRAKTKPPSWHEEYFKSTPGEQSMDDSSQSSSSLSSDFHSMSLSPSHH